MSRSAGTGSPTWFACYQARKIWYFDDVTRTVRERKGHRVTLTGRTKPNPSRRRNGRVSDLLREYRCSCGHVGWSSHCDLERMEAR